MAFDVGVLLSLKQFPLWFYWFAAGIQILGIVVSFAISYLGYQAYKLTNERKYRYFFYGFLFLGVNFLANLALNLLLRLGYAHVLVEKKYTLYVAPLFGVYYFFWIGLMLAYVSLAAVYSEMKKSNKLWLFYFWTFVVGLYTFRDKILFNMFAAVLLSFVVLYTYERYKENKIKSQLLTSLAFLCLFMFHLFVLLEVRMPVFFLIRYVILLVGLILLVITLTNIYGRKKK
jgi:hypothetical protein